MYDDFEFMNKKNPAKVKEWLDQANEVKKNSDELYNFLKDFKFTFNAGT